jgi:TM2 domain-containing membrane protein YozV
VKLERDHSPGVAFLLWLACLFGLCGLHRFYLGKPISGFLYLITLGLFGIGQIIDLARLDTMVEHADGRLAGAPPQLALARPPEDELRMSLLRAAAGRGGRLSVTQGVLATGRDFGAVERALDEMLRSGYVDLDNDPDSGIVIYRFGELG